MSQSNGHTGDSDRFEDLPEGESPVNGHAHQGEAPLGRG